MMGITMARVKVMMRIIMETNCYVGDNYGESKGYDGDNYGE